MTDHIAQEMIRHDQIGEILDQRQQKDARQLNQVNPYRVYLFSTSKGLSEYITTLVCILLKTELKLKVCKIYLVY